MKSYLVFLFLFMTLTSCMQNKEEDDLRAVPVTNNPHVVPASSSFNFMQGAPH